MSSEIRATIGAIHDKAVRGKPTEAQALERADQEMLRKGIKLDEHDAYTLRRMIHDTITLR